MLNTIPRPIAIDYLRTYRLNTELVNVGLLDTTRCLVPMTDQATLILLLSQWLGRARSSDFVRALRLHLELVGIRAMTHCLGSSFARGVLHVGRCTELKGLTNSLVLVLAHRDKSKGFWVLTLLLRLS